MRFTAQGNIVILVPAKIASRDLPRKIATRARLLTSTRQVYGEAHSGRRSKTTPPRRAGFFRAASDGHGSPVFYDGRYRGVALIPWNNTRGDKLDFSSLRSF